MSLFKKIYYYFQRHSDQRFQPVVIVTGAGSGIGWALAKLLLKELRYRVVITARAKTLETLRKTFPDTDRFWTRELDVTDEVSRNSLIREINEKWGGVNVLVNNAGISYRAVVEHMTETDEIKQMTTNYFGPMGLIRAVLPNMREHGRGKIICVSSVSGMVAMPTMSAYTASKHALEGACEALWYEAKPFGIDVCLVQPGFIRSNSFRNVYHTLTSEPEVAAKSPYRNYYKYMVPFVEKLMRYSPTNPKDVALTILKAIKEENPPLWIPATWDAIIFYYVRRILPRRFLLQILFFCLPKSSSWVTEFTKKRN